MRPPSVGDVFVGPKERRDDMGPSNSNKYNGDPCGIPRKEGVTEGEKRCLWEGEGEKRVVHPAGGGRGAAPDRPRQLGSVCSGLSWKARMNSSELFLTCLLACRDAAP